MAAGKARDLGEGVVHALRVEAAAAFEEGVLVEVADVWTAAGDDDGVRDQVQVPLHEVAANGRQTGERPYDGAILQLGIAAPEVGEEGGPRVLAGADEDRVRVGRRLLRQRGHVQAAEDDISALRAIVVGQPIRAAGGGDVDLDDDEVRLVGEIELLDMLVLHHDVVIGPQIRGQGREAQRREQRVLDRAEVGAHRLGERGQDHLHFHATEGIEAARPSPQREVSMR